MPRQQTRAGDVTGREKAKLAETHAAELAARRDEITLINSRAAEQSEEVVDLSDGPQSQPLAEPVVVKQADEDKVQEAPKGLDTTPGVEEVPEIEVQEVEEPVKIKEFRVNEDLENVTIGQGTNYNFYEGKKYRAPSYIYDHLDEKGYIWH